MPHGSHDTRPGPPTPHDLGRHPTRSEAAHAAKVLLQVNGMNMGEWTDDVWPDSEAYEVLNDLARND